jgi:hypothetical protein
MSSCGNTDPCAPVNPCDCVEPAAIREQGPPGPGGAPGGIPVFQIGVVIAGAVPAVTIVQVNPLLYTLNFVIPSANLTTPNTWTEIQTFQGKAVFNNGFTATGDSNIQTLTVGNLTVAGNGTYVGLQTFNGGAVFNGPAEFNGGADIDQLRVSGTIQNAGITQLPANTPILGTVAVDNCGNFFYQGTLGPNSTAGSSALAMNVPFNQAETAIPFSLPFVVPNLPACGVAQPAAVIIRGDVVTNAGGAIPVDISSFRVFVRLDNAVTGTILAQRIFTNFEAGGAWITNALIPPGAHTLFFTIAGLSVGSSTITLIAIDCSIDF